MTIPGFTPIEVEPQAHIHLGLIPRNGSSPSGLGSYNEPPYTFYHVEKRVPHFEGQYEFVEAIDGTPHDHTVLAGSGDALVKTDYQYTVRVSPTQEQILVRLLHNRVLLVDSRHCPDNQDHAPYTKKMAFVEMTYGSNYDPLLKFNQVNLTFKDMDTVAGL